MDWNFADLERALRYKLLVSLVVPRPIALISSISSAGVVNAAPFSFFNVMADEPPVVIVSIENRPGGQWAGRMKDSARNILETGEFVVNLVDESIAERMHGCSIDLPPETSEIDAVGLTTASSHLVRPPRVAEAPVSLECTLHSRIEIDTRHLLVGQVRWLHARDGLVDPATLRVDMDKYHPIGRLFADRYCGTREQFSLGGNAYLDQMKQIGRT